MDSVTEKIKQASRLQRQILILSSLYYEYDYSHVSDTAYEEIVKELLSQQEELKPVLCKATEYWNAFYDFEGNTGFYLNTRLTEKQREVIVAVAKDILYDAGIYDY